MEAAPIEHAFPLAAEVRQHHTATMASNSPPPMLVRARPGEPLRIEPAPAGAALPTAASASKPDVAQFGDKPALPQATAREPVAPTPLAEAPAPARLSASIAPPASEIPSSERGLIPKLSRWWRDRGEPNGRASAGSQVQAGDARTTNYSNASPNLIPAEPMHTAAASAAGMAEATGRAAVPTGFAKGLGTGPMVTPSGGRAAASLRPATDSTVAMRVRSQRMPLRTRPDAEAEIVGHLQQHTPVMVRGAGHGVWRRVEAGGLSGWALESWLESSR